MKVLLAHDIGMALEPLLIIACGKNANRSLYQKRFK